MPLTDEQKARRDRLRAGIERIALEAYDKREAERAATNDGQSTGNGRAGTAGNGGTPPKRRSGDNAAGTSTPQAGTPAQEPATGRRSLGRRAFYGRFGQPASK